MQIGRRLYYLKSTGEIIQDTGEREGSVVETTVEEDMNIFPGLVDKITDEVGFIQLGFGERREEILNMGNWYVDVEKNELVIIPTQ